MSQFAKYFHNLPFYTSQVGAEKAADAFARAEQSERDGAQWFAVFPMKSDGGSTFHIVRSDSDAARVIPADDFVYVSHV